MVDVVTNAAGNIIQYGNRDLSYNPANRLSMVEEDGIVLGSYIYNAEGQRVRKMVNGQTRSFIMIYPASSSPKAMDREDFPGYTYT